MWPAIFCVLSAAVSILSALAAFSHAQRAARASALPLEKALSVESRLLLVERSLNDASEVLTELANRVKMMKVRGSLRHIEDKPSEPDPYKDPDGWRKMMNRRLAMNKLQGD